MTDFETGIGVGMLLAAGNGGDTKPIDNDPDLTIWEQLPEPADNQFVGLIRVLNGGGTCYAWGECDEGIIEQAGTMSIVIDWGDGTVDSYDLAVDDNEQTGEPMDGAHSWYYTHVYTAAGDYVVTMTSGNTAFCSYLYAHTYDDRGVMAKFGDSIRPEKYLTNGFAGTSLSKTMLKYLQISANTDFTAGTGYFSGFNYLRQIVYNGDPLTQIPANTFNGCNSLNFNNWDFSAVTAVGDRAFSNCYNLHEIHLPACLNVGGYAFNQCYNLMKITYGAGCTFTNSAFAYCFGLYPNPIL